MLQEAEPVVICFQISIFEPLKTMQLAEQSFSKVL